MVQSFKYRVEGNRPEVRVHISQHFWSRLTKGLLWSIAWAVVAYSCGRLFGLTVPSVIGLIVSLLLALIGLVVANYSVVWSTFWLRPDSLKWREIRPFSWHIRNSPLLTVRDFGFAIFSHNGPVLRLDVDGTWFVLAEGIQEREADALLLDIRQRGVVFPLSSSERQTDAHASIPKFSLLD